jgi:hypothetical protein
MASGMARGTGISYDRLEDLLAALLHTGGEAS